MDSRKSRLTPYSQSLRKHMTKSERHLKYDFFRKLDLMVKYQYVIEPYILDFYIPNVRLAIELDGQQHYDDDAIVYDRKRTAFLEGKGITVLRYSNMDVERHFDSVCIDILHYLPETAVTQACRESLGLD